ncbi:MAG: DUF4402 domain-containing protein [Gemmatimonadales bacterium]|nr:DUF4402 domain-containing protein [Gemmatimonadales bacterium]
MFRVSRVTSLILGVSVLLSAQAMAQNNASATVSAVVQQPVTVTKNNDLSFGNVFPGVNKAIAVTAGGAAKFTVAGQASTPVNLTFSVPVTIPSGGNTLALNTWTGHHAITDVTSGGTTFTPSASATTATLSVLGNLYVYVGATAAPTTTQAAGTYSGSMTMTVVYF